MKSNNSDGEEIVDSKLPLQLAIVGKPNVGKSTLLNAMLQENRVLVGPEAGLTRDSIRVQFEYEGRNVYLVSIMSLCRVPIRVVHIILFYEVLLMFQ